jgi:hypothetical protein
MRKYSLLFAVIFTMSLLLVPALVSAKMKQESNINVAIRAIPKKVRHFQVPKRIKNGINIKVSAKSVKNSSSISNLEVYVSKWGNQSYDSSGNWQWVPAVGISYDYSSSKASSVNLYMSDTDQMKKPVATGTPCWSQATSAGKKAGYIPDGEGYAWGYMSYDNLQSTGYYSIKLQALKEAAWDGVEFQSVEPGLDWIDVNTDGSYVVRIGLMNYFYYEVAENVVMTLTDDTDTPVFTGIYLVQADEEGRLFISVQMSTDKLKFLADKDLNLEISSWGETFYSTVQLWVPETE